MAKSTPDDDLQQLALLSREELISLLLACRAEHGETRAAAGEAVEMSEPRIVHPGNTTDRQAIEASLRESKKRLTAIVSSAMDAIISMDEQQRIRVFNPAAERMFGLKAEAVIGRPLTMLLPERFRADHEAHTRQFAETGEPARVICSPGICGLRANGEEFPIEASISQITSAGGTMFTIILRDITERVCAEEALRKSQRQLLSFVEQAPISIAIFDRQMNYLATSNRWINEYGRGHDNLVGRSHYDIHPDVPEAWKEIHRQALAGGFLSSNGDLWIQADGSEHWQQWAAQPWTDDTGEIGGIIITVEDITHIRLAERALLDVQDDLNRAQAVGQIGSWRLNVQRNELTWSAENHRIFGITPGTPLSYETFLATVHPEDRGYVDLMWQAGLHGDPYDIEHRLIVDGEVKWVRETAELEFDDEGTLLGGFGITQEITERKRAEEALREADRRKNVFLATLSHELRNPLAPIRNAVELLNRLELLDPLSQSALNIIDRQLKHLARLIDDLMDVSRITHGKLVLRREQIELSAVLNQALETALPHLERAGHELNVSLTEQPVYLNADSQRLSQVFVNLLINAAKYTEPGGRVELMAKRKGTLVTVIVTDTGRGIQHDQLPHLFETFSQAGSETDTSRDGLGIGLSLARALVEMHGGHIEARSDGLGKGSQFIVRIPTLSDPFTEPPQPESVTKSLRSCRVLIADDNPDIANSLALLLQLTGNEVKTVYDGIEATEEATRFKPDILLLDIGMPKLDGFSTCRYIRQQSWGKDMVIIAMTGWGQDDDRRKAQEAGFDSHMVKPVDLSSLERAMKTLLADKA